MPETQTLHHGPRNPNSEFEQSKLKIESLYSKPETFHPGTRIPISEPENRIVKIEKNDPETLDLAGGGEGEEGLFEQSGNRNFCTSTRTLHRRCPSMNLNLKHLKSEATPKVHTLNHNLTLKHLSSINLVQGNLPHITIFVSHIQVNVR